MAYKKNFPGVVTFDSKPVLPADTIDSDHYTDGSIDLAHMSSESVDEDNLKISNAGSNGEFLSKSSNAGGLTWATPTNTNTNQLTTFTVSATTDNTAITISQDDDLFFKAGTGITCVTSADDEVTITNTSPNATHTGEVTGSTSLTIADNKVDEANLKVSNAPTNGYFLTAQSGNTGGLTWASGSPISGLYITNTNGSNIGLGGSGTNTLALENLSTGTGNTAIGYAALNDLEDGDYNVAVGLFSQADNVEGHYNTSMGYSSLNNCTVHGNTAIGAYASAVNIDGGASVAVGGYAGRWLLSDNNTSVGYKAGMGNKGVTGNDCTGGGNTAIGSYCLDNNDIGINNTAVGYGAMGAYDANSPTQGYNTCIGKSAGASLQTSHANVILGSFDGNEDSLDIRNSDNNIVLSDGDGRWRLHIESDGNMNVAGTVTATPTATLIIYNSAGTAVKTINGIAAA